MSRLYADPDGLKNRAKPYHDVASDIGAHAQEAKDIHTRHHSSWGDDELGGKFAETFVDGLTSLAERIEAIEQGIRYAGDGLHTNGATFADVEDGNCESAAALGGTLAGGGHSSVAATAPAARGGDDAGSDARAQD